MRIFMDCEFIEDGRTIDLISWGGVREDGAEFYAESNEVDLSRANDFVKAEVIPHLQGGKYRMPRWAIRDAVLDFAGPRPEFWAYFEAYDWVATAQLHGTMHDLPEHWPMRCRDIAEGMVRLGLSSRDMPEQVGIKHHALYDSRWDKLAFEFLESKGMRV